MKKLFFLILPAALFFSPLLWREAGAEAFAQTAGKAGNWTLKLAEVNKVFIENKGQFNSRLQNSGHETAIEYGTNYNGVEMYFTKSGITFRHDKFIPVSEAEMEEQEKQPAKKENREEEEQEKQLSRQPQFLSMTWQDANPNATITAEQAVSHYFTYYGGNDNTTIHARAFKKIICKNMYPNIDVEYVFPDPPHSGRAGEGSGFKYNIILHPGANPATIKMYYTGAEEMYLNAEGNIVIVSSFGNFVDHAPVTYNKAGSVIRSAFQLNGSSVSFQLDDKSLSQKGRVGEELTIDPWVQLPVLNGSNACDIDWDYQGNVYAYGPFEVIKLNKSGTILWQAQPKYNYNASNYGDFAVNRFSGDVYICHAFNFRGAKVFKLDANGNQTNMHMSSRDDENGPMAEFIRIAYNSYTNQGVIGGGGVTNNCQAVSFDENFVKFNHINILSAVNPYHDVSMLTLGDTSCYFFTVDGYFGYGHNTIVKCPLSNLSPTTYIAPTNHNLTEETSKYNGKITWPCGYNGMAKSKHYLYTYDGKTLNQWNPSDGSFRRSLTVGTDTVVYGGIAVDECDESIYLGVAETVRKYDSTFALITTFVTPNLVYDVALGMGGNLVACGSGFVSSLVEPDSVFPASFNININTTPSTCTGNDGGATVNATPSALYSFSFLWPTSGETTSSITGLSPGKYPVYVFLNDSMNCTAYVKSDTAFITASSGFTAQSHTTTPSCSGYDGTATENAVGGTVPYAYLWIPGKQTTQKAVGLSAGTYTVLVTDALGCQISDEVTVAPSAAIDFSTFVYSNCQLSIYHTGGTFPFTYLWTPGNSTSQIIVPPSVGNYSVTVTDVVGCILDTSITIAHPSISGGDTICNGESTVLSAPPGGVSYLWSTGSSNSSIAVSPVVNSYYYVLVVNNATCTDTAKITVVVQNPAIDVNNNITIAYGSSALLSVAENGSYYWSPQKGLSCTNCQFTSANPLQTTTYYITVTDIDGCSATDSITVFVNCGDVFVPTAFSPNNDGYNDVLYPKISCAQSIDFKIYDRWGNNVFQSTNVTDGWDGTYRGKPMDPAVLVYYVNAVLLSGETITKKGNISLIK